MGTSPPRIDIPEKVVGTYTYLHSIQVPGMLHGRLIRPRGQGAHGDGTNPGILAIDENSIKHIPDVQIVRKGNFLGVVARREYDAIQAAAQLKVTWADPPRISGSGNLLEARCASFDSAGQATPAAIQFQKGDRRCRVGSSAAHVVLGLYLQAPTTPGSCGDRSNVLLLPM